MKNKNATWCTVVVSSLVYIVEMGLYISLRLVHVYKMNATHRWYGHLPRVDRVPVNSNVVRVETTSKGHSGIGGAIHSWVASGGDARVHLRYGGAFQLHGIQVLHLGMLVRCLMCLKLLLLKNIPQEWVSPRRHDDGGQRWLNLLSSPEAGTEMRLYG